MKNTIQGHRRPTSRAERRGMPLSEWKRQNTWPRAEHLNRLLAADHPGPSDGMIDAEDIRLIALLNEHTGGHGVSKTELAQLYFPQQDRRSAMAQLDYELRCCRGLQERLDRLYHRKGNHRFTCMQAEQIILLYGSPPVE